MKRGIIYVFLTALISGCAIFINKLGVNGIDSTVFTFMKNIIVSLFLLAIILGFKEFSNLKKLDRKSWFSLILIGFVGGSVPFVLFFRGLQLTSGPTGAFIHKTMFIVVAVLAFMFLKEKLTKKVFIPALILLIGNFMLLKLTSFELSTGTLLISIATVFWAVENIISKHTLKTMSPTIMAFGRMFFGSLFIMVYMSFTGNLSLVFTLTPKQFSWILLSTPLLLLYVITWYTGLKSVKVTTATSILLLGSPVTTILSFVFLGTALTMAQAIGILLVLAGVIFSVLLIEKEPNAQSIVSAA